MHCRLRQRYQRQKTCSDTCQSNKHIISLPTYNKLQFFIPAQDSLNITNILLLEVDDLPSDDAGMKNIEQQKKETTWMNRLATKYWQVIHNNQGTCNAINNSNMQTQLTQILHRQRITIQFLALHATSSCHKDRRNHNETRNALDASPST